MPAAGRGWLWWGKPEPIELHEKRDQVLTFLENELDGPDIAAQIDEVRACMHLCTPAVGTMGIFHRKIEDFECLVYICHACLYNKCVCESRDQMVGFISQPDATGCSSRSLS